MTATIANAEAMATARARLRRRRDWSGRGDQHDFTLEPSPIFGEVSLCGYIEKDRIATDNAVCAGTPGFRVGN